MKLKSLLLVLLLPSAAGAQLPVYRLDTLRVQAASRLGGNGSALFRSVAVIDRETLDLLPSNTIADVLQRVLGLDVRPRSPAQNDVSIRGSSFEQVLVLVDGVRVTDEQTGHFDLDLAVPLAAIERIEVLRGPNSSLYGSDAVGGVINIVTRRDARITGSLQGGTFDTRAVSAGVARTASAWLFDLTADHARSDGHREGTDYELTQARAAISRPTRIGSVQLDAGVANRDFGAADFYGAYPSHERTTTLTTRLGLVPNDGPGWRLTPQLSFRRHTDLFTLFREDPSIYQNEHESTQATGELVARRTGERVRFAMGLEGFSARLNSARLGDREEDRLALFGESTVGNLKRAALNAGLRIDWGKTFRTFASPSIAATLQLNESVGLRASGTRGFRVPTWTERYYRDPSNIGDPNLQPEEFWNSEVGARARISSRVDVDLSGFYRVSDQLIDWARPSGSPPTTPWRTMNVEQVEVLGGEAQLELMLPADAHVILRAAALSFTAEGAAGMDGKYGLDPLTHDVGIAAAIPLPGNFLFAFDTRHAQREGEESFWRADARLNYTLRDFSFVVDLQNLTDADYRDAVAKRVSGRALTIGARWKG